MYARQPSYRGMRIPQNYRGTAFPTEENDVKNAVNDIPPLTENAEMSQNTAESEADFPENGDLHENRCNGKEPPSAAVSSPSIPSQKRDSARSLPHLGVEDALILGLILLVINSDSRDDLWIFLALLLFV